MLLGLQVKMAQENLLQHLYTYATHLNPLELEAMLNEDPELMQKRAAAQMAVKVLIPPACVCLWRVYTHFTFVIHHIMSLYSDVWPL